MNNTTNILFELYPLMKSSTNGLFADYKFLCVDPLLTDEDENTHLYGAIEEGKELLCLLSDHQTIYGMSIMNDNYIIEACYNHAVATKQKIAFFELVEKLAKLGIKIERRRATAGYLTEDIIGKARIDNTYDNLINDYLYSKLEELFERNPLISILFEELQNEILTDEDIINEFINLFMAFGVKTLQELGDITICQN